MQYLYLALLAFVFLISGCNHSDRVVDLIYGKYPNLKEGGDIEFVAYQENYKTKWAVRTFTAKGVVRWDKKWFVLNKKYTGKFGIVDIIIVSECSEVNEGVPFNATFYKGRIKERGFVSLDIKSSVDLFTEKTLRRKYGNKCIIKEGGAFVGNQFDSKQYYKIFNERINRGNQFIKKISMVYSNNVSQVEKLCSVDFKKLNNDKLDEYLSDCTSVLGRFFIPNETVFYRDELEYFMSFPVKDLGQDMAKDLFQRCEIAEDAFDSLKNKLNDILKNVKKEKESRARRGVRFLSATGEIKNKGMQNEIKMPLHNKSLKSGVLKAKIRNENSTLESTPKQSVIVMPLKNNYALPSNGKKDVVVPVTKPMVITMPK